MRLVRLLLFLLVFMVPFSVSFAQTGKIAGTVTDASTGETIPGVNVAIEGTTQGAVTDADGFYTIINVRHVYGAGIFYRLYANPCRGRARERRSHERGQLRAP